MEKNDDKAAVTIVKTAPQLGYVSQDSEPSGLWKSVKCRRNSCRKVLGSNGRARFTLLRYVKQVSEKIKVHCLEKKKDQSKLHLSQILTLWDKRTDFKKRQQVWSDAPWQGMETCLNIYQLREKDKSYIVFAFWRVVFCLQHHPLIGEEILW